MMIRLLILPLLLAIAAMSAGCSTVGKFDNVLTVTLPGTPPRAFGNSTYGGFSMGLELRKEDAERLQEMIRAMAEYQMLLRMLVAPGQSAPRNGGS